MNKELEKLNEIKANIEKFDKQYRELKGYGECCDKPCPAEIEDRLYSMCQNIYRYIDSSISYIYQWQDRHSSGHLPPIQGAEKLQNALKTLGISEDYEVNKRQLWASVNSQGNNKFEVELKVK